MGRIVVLLVCVASCNAVYDLDPTTLRPPEEALDTDGDGVADAFDNCPDVASDTQNDEDNDSIGDVCDNCPLVNNPDQNDVGDGDGVGDRCDPHAESRGDCLVLYDSFDHDFTEAWDVLGGSASAKPGNVELTPDAGGVALVARGHTGTFDVIVAGDVTLGLPATTLFAAIGITSPMSGLVCGVGFGTRETVLAGSYPPQPYAFGPSLGSIGLLRLIARASPTNMGCRAALGVAEDAFETGATLPANGGPGVLATGRPSTIRGVAIYAQRTPCNRTMR